MHIALLICLVSDYIQYSWITHGDVHASEKSITNNSFSSYKLFKFHYDVITTLMGCSGHKIVAIQTPGDCGVWGAV